MTDSPSKRLQGPSGGVAATDTADDIHINFAERLSSLVGAAEWTVDHDTIQIRVSRDRWVETLCIARDDGALPFFSWLSVVDWSKEVAVGDPVEDVDGLEERYEVLARVSSVSDAMGVIFVATVPKDEAWIDSLVAVFAGAAWHEREAAEMFGIDFRGHPYLAKLYLPDSFEGYPLRKSFALLSREVKPWPGMVNVEDMPSVENVEAAGPEASIGDGET